MPIHGQVISQTLHVIFNDHYIAEASMLHALWHLKHIFNLKKIHSIMTKSLS